MISQGSCSGMIVKAMACYRIVGLSLISGFVSMLVAISNSQAAERPSEADSAAMEAQLDLLIDLLVKSMQGNQNPVAKKQQDAVYEAMLDEFLKDLLDVDETPRLISRVLERNRELSKSPDKLPESIASLDIAATLIAQAHVMQLDDPLPRTETAQLILQALQLQQKCQGEERMAWATEIVMIRLMPVTSSRDVLEVVAPQLNTDDEKLRKKLFEVLHYKLKDFGDISALLRKNEGVLEPRLVHYMIQQDSAAAMVILARYFLKDPQQYVDVLDAYRTLDNRRWKKKVHINLTEEILPEERAAVQLLAKHEQWWARLCVVELVREDDDLGYEEVLQQLVEDEHPLVREVMAPLARRRPQ